MLRDVAKRPAFDQFATAGHVSIRAADDWWTVPALAIGDARISELTDECLSEAIPREGLPAP